MKKIVKSIYLFRLDNENLKKELIKYSLININLGNINSKWIDTNKFLQDLESNLVLERRM